MDIIKNAIFNFQAEGIYIYAETIENANLIINKIKTADEIITEIKKKYDFIYHCVSLY